MTDRRPPNLPPPLPAPPSGQQRHEPQRPQTLRPQQQPSPPQSQGAHPQAHVPQSQYPQAYAPPPQRPQGHAGAHHPGPPVARPTASLKHAEPRSAPKRRPDEWGKRADDADEGWGVLAYVGFGVLALLLTAGAAVGYLLINPPVDLIRSQLIAHVKASTGRELKIGGPTKFKFYPSLAVEMASVQLSAPPKMGGRPLLSSVGLEVRLRLLPLLMRKVEIERFVLRQPVIEFRTDKVGRRTWDLTKDLAEADPELPRRIELAQAATPNRATDAPPAAQPAAKSSAAAVAKAQPLALLSSLAFEDVRLINGVIVWHDERTAVREAATGVNVTIGMRSIDGTLDTKGDLVFKGERFEVTSTLASLQTILDAKPAKLAFNANNRFVAFSYDGSLTTASGPDAAGTVTFKSPNVRSLAKLAGAELPPGKGFGPASLTGKLKADQRGAMLTDATMALDGATATGTLGIDIGASRPLVTGNLKLSELNFNKYLGSPDAAGAAPPAPASPTNAPSASAPAPATKSAGAPGTEPGSIDDLLSRPGAKPGPQVKGFAQRAGWSDAPIVTAALGAIDADLKLQVQKVFYQEIKVGQSQLSIALKNKVLKTTFDDVQLYQGRGRGFVTVDASGEIPSLGANITADGIAAQPLLKDTGDMEWLAGTGKLALAIAGQGASQKDIMESLNGKADLTFNNGAIIGWNVAQIIRGLKQGQLSGFERVETSKTDFSELSSTWAIAAGVAQNQDLKMTTPLLRVTGAGRVAIGARQLDYVVKPKVVASLDGQGGAQGLAGLEVPLRVRGPWEKPEIQPELGGILKDPNKAIGAIKEISKQFKGKKPNEIVDQVLGGNPEAAKKANDLLNQFTKPKKQAQPAGAQ